MRLIDADKLVKAIENENPGLSISGAVEKFARIAQVNMQSTIEAIPVWYIIRWYEKKYKLGSTVADDWERALLKEEIAKMHNDFKNDKYLDNKQESERFVQMVKEVIELYNDWEEENDR